MKRIAIIGGGISGLSALHFLRRRFGDGCEVVLFEREGRLGGTIGADRSNGFVSDWGPNGFLDRVPLTLQMVHELGADDKLFPARSASGKRFIYRHGRLHEISPSPPAFLRSPLLSVRGRLRLVGEPFIRKRRGDEDESIFDFAVRRIGREAAETLIDPMVSGIFGGDARALSLQACFPIMREMEDKHGSLVRALIARKRAAAKAGHEKSPGPAGPAGHLTSFVNGLFTLIEVFAATYREHIVIGVEIEKIVKTETGYRLVNASGDGDRFDAVICAAPAYVASSVTADLDNALSHLLAEIPYAPIAVVCLGYRRQDVGHDLNGFGFLVPRSEGKRILGSIWTSSIFPNQAPEGMVQLRTMIGGATDPPAAGLADDALLDIVTNDLRPIVGITGPPIYIRIFKYDRGIPQFVIGHPQRMQRLDDLLRNHQGLYFTGNAYKGVGLNDCVVRSEQIASQAADYLQLTPTSANHLP